MFIGQEKAVEEIDRLSKNFANLYEKPNLLILGNSGYGKTTLAIRYAEQTGVPYQIFLGGSGVNHTKTVHIIDEAHMAKEPEMYYGWMDQPQRSFALTTTHTGLLPEPFWNRCFVIQLKEYTIEQLLSIVNVYMWGEVPKPIALPVVVASRGVPRVIKKLSERLFAQHNTLTPQIVTESLFDWGYLDDGITIQDIKYFDVLVRFGGKASLSTLTKSLNEQKETIENTYEPFLLRYGYIFIDNRGRNLTGKGLNMYTKYKSLLYNGGGLW